MRPVSFCLGLALEPSATWFLLPAMDVGTVVVVENTYLLLQQVVMKGVHI